MSCEMGNHGMQYIYQADKINGEISKPYKDVYYMNCRGGKKLIIGGGGADTHIFVFTDCKNNRLQIKRRFFTESRIVRSKPIRSHGLNTHLQDGGVLLSFEESF